MKESTFNLVMNIFMTIVGVGVAVILLLALLVANKDKDTKIHIMPEVEIVKWLDTSGLDYGVYAIKTGSGWLYCGVGVDVFYDPFPKGHTEVK